MLLTPSPEGGQHYPTFTEDQGAHASRGTCGGADAGPRSLSSQAPRDLWQRGQAVRGARQGDGASGSPSWGSLPRQGPFPIPTNLQKSDEAPAGGGKHFCKFLPQVHEDLWGGRARVLQGREQAEDPINHPIMAEGWRVHQGHSQPGMTTSSGPDPSTA